MDPEPNWPINYFNYFTEIEERFQQARGTGLFLLSPLDWALIESWKEAGIPLEAALRGIDVSFEKWREKKQRGRMVNSLAWCTQAVVEEAERMAGNVPQAAPRAPVEAPFTLEQLAEHLRSASARISQPDLASVRAALGDLQASVGDWYGRLEELEQRLSALEDKMIATVRAAQSDDDLAAARRQLDAQLRPYRGKMTAPQLAMLEKQYLDRWMFESRNLPRLSLFYLR
ncbi:MAG: hypothetical protein R2762_03565 [Bryobacteraceae bacterium]